MNKKESKIILDTYKNIFSIQEICKLDKADTIREMKNLLDMLDMKKERYIIENEIIAERDNLSFSQKEMFSLIFNMFLKYGKYVHYELDEVEMYYDDLQFEMTEEENNCYKAQIKYILNHPKAA